MKKKVIAYIIFSLFVLNQLHMMSKINEKEKEIFKMKNIQNEIIIQNKNFEKNNQQLQKEIEILVNENNLLKEENIKLKEEKKYITKNAIVSYYTHLPEEGGGQGITASGKKLSNTSLAIPRKDNILKFGTEVEFEFLSDGYMKDYNKQYLKRIADDTGNPKYIRKIDENTYKLDIYCPKLSNETDTQYKKRVMSYGKTKTTIKIYK